jgi:hypothetical protein
MGLGLVEPKPFFAMSMQRFIYVSWLVKENVGYFVFTISVLSTS